MNKSQTLTKKQQKIIKEQATMSARYRWSIRLFIKDVWGLVPQPCKPEYKKRIQELELASYETWERLKTEVTADWYGGCEVGEGGAPDIWTWDSFIKGTHFTWQQNLILMGIEKSTRNNAKDFLSIVSGHGTGKLLDYNVMIDTPKGKKRWGDLSTGDLLFDSQGKPTKIVNTIHFKKAPMYRVTFDDRSFCEVSSGHLWNVKGRQERRNKINKWRTLETIEILRLGVKRKNGVSMANQWEIPTQGAVQYKNKKVKIAPYLMGVWLGDGGRGTSRFTSADEDVVKRIKDLGYELTSCVKKGTFAKSYYIQNVLNLFKGFDVFNKYSYEKSVPIIYKENSIEVRSEVLRGLMDTDGAVGKKGETTFSSTSKILAEDVVWLARSLGGKATLQPSIKKPFYKDSNGKKIQGRDCYGVTINMPRSFTSFYIKRKQDRIKKEVQDRYLKRFIDKIEPINPVDGMCVTVANKDGLYLANDFIVTHNSTTCSWIVLWFLYCYHNSQVAVTAPTSSQMHDVLWKELSIWLSKMPQDVAEMYEWTRDYIRMAHAPADWFARARTASKENTEAIAGVHSESGVAIICDEASGVPEKIFETMLGALTSKNVLIILISNGTRPLGYFYDSHHRTKEDWQTFRFSSEESPIVDKKYIKTIAKQFGIDSEEYRIRSKGLFPDLGNMDTSGYMQLMSRNKITVRIENENSVPFMGRNILGVDPSGEGQDKTVFVLRDQFKAKVIHERATSNPKQIAEDILTFIDRYSLDPHDVVVDSFGVGADVAKEVAIASGGRYDIYSVLIGNAPEYEEGYNSHLFERNEDEVVNPEGELHKWKDLYLNLRALSYFRIKKWISAGGELVDVSVDHSNFVEEIIVNRYKRTLQGNKIQMMPKNEMMKMGIKSTNCFVSGTKITTPNGYINIEKIKEGDFVTTPCGDKKVIKTWKSTTDKITTIHFSNGKILSGKGAHKIFTWDKGWVRLDALTLTNLVETDNIINILLWKFAKKLNTKGEHTTFKERVNTIAQEDRAIRSAYFTGRNGQISMGKFLKVLWYITLMAIDLIILLPILKLKKEVNTFKTTCENGLKMSNIGKKIKKIWKELDRWLLNGMGLRKELSGIQSMAKRHGKGEKKLFQSALAVVRNMKHFSLRGVNSVHEVVSRKGVTKDKKPLRQNVRDVIKNFWRTNIAKCVFVEKVVQEQQIKPREVYNLTLESDNIYYANGILVENCSDALSLTLLRDLVDRNNPPERHSDKTMVLLEEEKAVGEDRFNAI